MRLRIVGLGFWVLATVFSQPGAADAADAKELFVDGKCIRCHSVEAQGVAARPRTGDEDAVTDLSKAGTERTVEWMQQYLRKEVDLEGVRHPLKYRGSDEDLRTLAAWLAALK
jgi:cytochrome c553